MADSTKKCPFCAEEIKSDAKKCKHCGEMLASAPAPEPAKVRSLGLGMIFGYLLGIVCVLSAIGALVVNPAHTVVWLIMAALVLPPVVDLMERKYKVRLSGTLRVVLVIGGLFVLGATAGPSTPGIVRPSSNASPAEAQPLLELESANASKEYSFAVVRGMVKNISDQPLKNVEAVAIFSDKDGNFITSDSALIDYNPILAGQSSPFTVHETDNPAIAKWRVEFKDLLGGSIPHRDISKSK